MDIEKELKNYLGAIIKYSSQMYLESPVSDKDDLMQAGFIGMINGLESFSQEKADASGTKKTTYVIQCIRNSILQEANKFYGAISLPHNKRLRLNAFKTLLNKGIAREEIKSSLAMNDTEYEELFELANLRNVSPLSLLLEDEEPNPVEVVENNLDTSFLKNFGLNDDEIQILNFKLSGFTYSNIAEHYNVSRETMRKRVHKVINKLKKIIKNNE